MNLPFYFLCAIIVFLGTVSPARAYLDPGSGSFIFQLVLGAILGALVTLRLTFSRVKRFFVARFSRKHNDQPRQ